MSQSGYKPRDPLGRLRSGYVAASAIALTIALMTAWATVSEVETSVRADGTVIPIGLNRRAQHLEGGIVKDLLVKEGDRVKTGQVLVRIAPTQANSDIGERHAKIEGLKAQVARLSAEAEGAENFALPPNASDAMRAEASAFISSRAALIGRLASLEDDARRSEDDARAKQAQLAGLRVQEAAIVRSLTLQQNALKAGGGSQGRLNDVETQLAAIRAQMAPLPDAIKADASGAASARARRDVEIAAVRAEAAQKLAQARSELASLMQNTASFEDRLSRTDVLSPVDGIIQKLSVNDVGEVLPPNSTVAEIVPVDDGLVVEAKVKPEDMRGLHPGLPALVRMSAYDVSHYGTLEGNVISLAPDVTHDEKSGQNYFRVRIKTQDSTIGGEPVRIGMQANVSIITGQRTVIHYLTSPLVDWSQTALRER